jgi:hypothetical protein
VRIVLRILRNAIPAQLRVFGAGLDEDIWDVAALTFSKPTIVCCPVTGLIFRPWSNWHCRRAGNVSQWVWINDAATKLTKTYRKSQWLDLSCSRPQWCRTLQVGEQSCEGLETDGCGKRLGAVRRSHLRPNSPHSGFRMFKVIGV